MCYLQCLTSLQHVNVNVQNIVKTMKNLKDYGTRWQTSQQGNLQGLLLSVYFHFFFHTQFTVTKTIRVYQNFE